MNTNKKYKNKFKIRLCGPFWLGTPDNNTIPVLSKKSRALIAILATAKNAECPRSVLQNKLWSRGSAKDSLRKELSNLRKLFNQYSLDVFAKNVARDIVKFNIDRFDIDIKRADRGLDGEFLEGLDLSAEEEFEDWLRSQRAYYDRIQNARADENRESKIDEVAGISKALKSPRIRIAVRTDYHLARASKNTQSLSLCEDIVSRIVNLLMHSGGVDLFDYNVDSQIPDLTRFSSRSQPHADLFLKVLNAHDGLILSVQLKSNHSGRIIFSRKLGVSRSTAGNTTHGTSGSKSINETDSVDQFIVETVDEILFNLTQSKEAFSGDEPFAAKLVYDAVENLFKVTPEGLDIARTNLDAAIELDRDAVFYAWRAYTMTHYLDDPRVDDFKRLKDEANYYVRKALELDPYNPLVLSLLTHVYSFGFKQFNTAGDMISKAKSLGSDHVMTHDAEALLMLYTGNLDQAKRPAIQTTRLSRYLNFRHCFITTQCMINGLQGHHRQAIKAGEIALNLQNNDLNKAYPPTVRYLAANYKKVGEFEKAFRLIESLNRRKRTHANTSLRYTEHIIPNLEIGSFVNV